jgi:hypothetical protein
MFVKHSQSENFNLKSTLNRGDKKQNGFSFQC